MTLLPVLLPKGYVPKVSVNDKLAKDSIIAEKKEVLEEVIHVAKDLDIPPAKISKTLKKNLGDAVSKGEVLAVKGGILGVSSKKIISEFLGTIVKIDEQNGDVFIRENAETGNIKTLISPVDGVVDFCDNEKIVIKTDKDAILAQSGLGVEGEGELLFIGNFNESKLTNEIEEKVILVDTIDKLGIFKAIGLGAKGIISGKYDEGDFFDLSTRIVNTPIMLVSKEDFTKLISASGKRVYLGGKDKSIIIL